MPRYEIPIRPSLRKRLSGCTTKPRPTPGRCPAWPWLARADPPVLRVVFGRSHAEAQIRPFGELTRSVIAENSA